MKRSYVTPSTDVCVTWVELGFVVSEQGTNQPTVGKTEDSNQIEDFGVETW